MEMEKKPIIKTQDLSLIYDLGQSYETKALLDVNIEIYPEEYVIIYGPSGCGKSTLLYCISCLKKPTSGKVWLNNKEISSLTREEAVDINRFEMGMIFQAYHLVPSLSVLDNVILPQVFCGGDPKKRDKKAKELLDHFDILKQANKFPSELSGGQRQRVSVARSMINDPSIIIADEPVGNLDSKSTEVVMHLLEELNKKFKKTVILVTHDDRFLHYADRVFYMKDGKVIKETHKDKVRDRLGEETTHFSGTINRLVKIFPDLTSDELKAKALAEHLLIDFTPDEINRLEKIIVKRISGEISSAVLEKVLDDPYPEGGMGFYRQTAQEFTSKIDKILKETDLLEQKVVVYNSSKTEVDLKVEEMRRYLLDNNKHIQLNFEQLKKLDSAIKKVIGREISNKDFRNELDLAFSQGGVGLNSRTARHLARELEIVLTQE